MKMEDFMMIISAKVCLIIVFRDCELPADTVELLFVFHLTDKVFGFLEIRQHVLNRYT